MTQHYLWIYLGVCTLQDCQWIRKIDKGTFTTKMKRSVRIWLWVGKLYAHNIPKDNSITSEQSTKKNTIQMQIGCSLPWVKQHLNRICGKIESTKMFTVCLFLFVSNWVFHWHSVGVAFSQLSMLNVCKIQDFMTSPLTPSLFHLPLNPHFPK